MSETFTIDELLAVLMGSKQAASVPGAYTLRELQDILTPMGPHYIRRLLRPHIESGRVECVRVPYTRIDGTVTTVPAYRLTGGNHDEGSS